MSSRRQLVSYAQAQLDAAILDAIRRQKPRYLADVLEQFISKRLTWRALYDTVEHLRATGAITTYGGRWLA